MSADDRRGLRGILSDGPPGPFDRRVWRSPLRGPWMASVLSLALLVLYGISATTGYFSYVAYEPTVGDNNIVGGAPTALFGWTWPTEPSWLYALNQSLHVLAGVAAIPFLAAKLWAIMPKFYKWPPARSPAQALERLTLALLIGSAIFLVFTGLWNIGYWYPWDFGFVQAHVYAAFVFVGSILSHIVLKLPTMRRAFRERGALRPLRDDLRRTEPEPYREDVSAPLEPDPPTVSRRGMLAAVGGTSVLMTAVYAGQSLGGWARPTALLAPRGQFNDDPGAQDFQINQTAEKARITPELVGSGYRLEVVGPGGTMRFSRPELLRLGQATEDLPIACVEGWVSWQTWTGVRLRDLAEMVGGLDTDELFVESLQPVGAFDTVSHSVARATDPQSLLALKVAGSDLSLDHGFPARIIMPATPGVHCTKWVKRLTFRS